MQTDFLKYKGASIFIFLLFIISHSQADIIAKQDTIVVNETMKQVFTEVKRGLSRETMSYTIIASVASSIVAIGIFIIRKRIRETKLVS